MTEPVPREVRWVKPVEGPVNLYANFVEVFYTPVDVSVAAGRIIPKFAPINPTQPLEVEEQGTVTMSWWSAKILRDQLTQLIASYEKANGEIKPPVLPSMSLPDNPTTGTGGNYKN
jgi:hypothetical protein